MDLELRLVELGRSIQTRMTSRPESLSEWIMKNLSDIERETLDEASQYHGELFPQRWLTATCVRTGFYRSSDGLTLEVAQ